MTNKRAQELLTELAAVEGCENPFDLLDRIISDSIVPAICSNGDCGYTTDLEPDSREGYCDECESHSMISAIELMLEGGL